MMLLGRLLVGAGFAWLGWIGGEGAGLPPFDPNSLADCTTTATVAALAGLGITFGIDRS